MILKYTLENFYSFREKGELKFVVNKHAPKSESYLRSKYGVITSKVKAVVGPNASGKTNLLKALPFLKWFINDSFNRLTAGEEILVEPFLFDGNKKQTNISVDFELNSGIYRYVLSLAKKRVYKEELLLKTKTRFKYLFVREWDSSKKKHILKNRTDLDKKFIIRENASVISTAIKGVGSKDNNLKEVFDYWAKTISDVAAVGKIKEDKHIPEAINYFYNHDDDFKNTEDFIKSLDLGLEGIHMEVKKGVEKETGKTFRQVFLQGIHFNKKREKKNLPFVLESGGTKNLFLLMRKIAPVLRVGGLAILDEIDADLHPQMIPILIDLFTSKDSNPKNAQLLFSTHHSQLLKRLDKYQIVFVEKNNEGASECWGLDEIKGVRVDDNYFDKYLAGAYGAVPHV